MTVDWKIIVVATVIVLLGSVALFGPSSRARGGHDGPGYRVVERDGNMEVRDYEEYTTAYVDVASDFDGAIYAGFMKLFNYISGKNTNRSKIKMTVPVTEEQVTGSEKIPMTAPVTSEKVSGDVYRVSFIMPANYTLDTLPVPDDKGIKFKRLEPYRAAVTTFPGRMNESLANKKSEELKRWLDKNGLQARSNFIAAQYDPPWIPGFMRKNEVIVEI
jgi:DNA gyrase inhibitor GyrI